MKTGANILNLKPLCKKHLTGWFIISYKLFVYKHSPWISKKTPFFFPILIKSHLIAQDIQIIMQMINKQLLVKTVKLSI